MKVLITGSTGFVGQHRMHHLLNNSDEVIGVGRANHKSAQVSLRPHVTGHYEYINDIADYDRLNYIVSRHKPDRIEHFASVATVSVSRNNPIETYRVNVMGTITLLEVAKRHNIPVMCFTTDKVYGYASQIADEGTFLMPDAGEYENSKTLQDMVAQSYNLKSHNITIVRSCNIYGPDDYNSRIVPNIIRDLKNEQPVIIYDNINTIRQFIYIKDLMSALDIIIKKGWLKFSILELTIIFRKPMSSIQLLMFGTKSMERM